MSPVEKKILLLGKGYVAQAFAQRISDDFPWINLTITSREKPECVYFELEKQASWENITDEYDACVWTFPVYDLKLFQQFFNQKKSLFKKFILLGTTSSYNIDYDQQMIHEQSDLDVEHKRYAVEKYLLQHEGIILRCAGIYGPEKNPLNWVKQGKIKSPPQKYVNWIHVSDLVQFIVHAILYGKMGESYIAADGCPVQWQAFYDYYKVRPVENKTNSKKLSKKINNQWTLEQLKVDLNYPSILLGQCKS
ncbi:hypothetical protein MRY82_08250 [bacterium]|nr:hypothetical protein [bacterium]